MSLTDSASATLTESLATVARSELALTVGCGFFGALVWFRGGTCLLA